MLRFLSGVSAGKMAAKGSAIWSRNSGSGRARWKVIVLPLMTIPCDRSQDFGVFTQASPPLIALYQEPAFGLSPILNSRSKVALTSCGVTVLPLEDLIPERGVNVYVNPSEVVFGIAVARSGTSVFPPAPPTRLNAIRPSCVMIRNCHSWRV